MKKALIFLLSASLTVAALASCGAEPPKEEPTKPLTQSTNSDTPAASTPTPEPEQKTTPVPKETPEPEPEPIPEPEPEESPEETPPAEPQLFTEVNETVYVIDTDSLNTRSGPGTNYDTIGSLPRGDSATRIDIGIDGTEAEGWSIVKLSDGSIVYVSSKYLSTMKPEAKSSGNSGGSNSGTTTSKPAASTPKQEASAESGNGSSEVGSDGLTDAERAWIERHKGENEFGQDTRVDPDELREHGNTNGGTAIYH